MQEPAAPVVLSLLALFVAALGPVVGPYALIVFAAAAGSVLLLSAHRPETPYPRWHGTKFVAMGAAVALLLTGPCVWVVNRYTDVPANIALIPVAFVLGLGRDHLIALTRKVLEATATRLEALINLVADQKGGER